MPQVLKIQYDPDDPAFAFSLPPNSTYIGRPNWRYQLDGIWGNPFTLERDGSRERVVWLYVSWFPISLIQRLDEIKGRDLFCWCKPLLCHGDFLIEAANEESVSEVIRRWLGKGVPAR